MWGTVWRWRCSESVRVVGSLGGWGTWRFVGNRLETLFVLWSVPVVTLPPQQSQPVQHLLIHCLVFHSLKAVLIPALPNIVPAWPATIWRGFQTFSYFTGQGCVGMVYGWHVFWHDRVMLACDVEKWLNKSWLWSPCPERYSQRRFGPWGNSDQPSSEITNKKIQ